ncbi:MAG TPA: hypothetical protein P5081_01195 [Phycisphaerae bacterium]|mgnify:CR=1 FL=1|nr:hypothetical protein [Phycisphaerae bacterium]HRW51469.1 hypothetical protein [Phycisphaerae bacterium]
MRTLIAITLALALSTALVRAQTPDTKTVDTDVRFVAYDVFIDAGADALAAYQIEISDLSGRAKIVGVEGGETTAFDAPPYYDPKALNGEGRIILGAFTTEEDGPTGRTRVARLHMQIEGEPAVDFDVQLVVAADSNARDIDANVTLIEGKQ